MANTCTAVFERDGDWYVAWCPEVPGANGQGRTREEARSRLASAIDLIFEDRREDALRYLPDEAERDSAEIPNCLAGRICRMLEIPMTGG